MSTQNFTLGLVRSAMFSIVFFLVSTLSAQSTSRAVPKDNIAIENDVSAVNAQQAKVKELEKKYKENLRAGRKETAMLDEKELSKARAELKKDRSFLHADIRDVNKYNRLELRNSRRAIRYDKADLRASRKALHRAEKRGDDTAIKNEKARVRSFESTLTIDQERLKLEQDKRSFDRAFIRSEMKRLEGSKQKLYLSSL